MPSGSEPYGEEEDEPSDQPLPADGVLGEEDPYDEPDDEPYEDEPYIGRSPVFSGSLNGSFSAS